MKNRVVKNLKFKKNLISNSQNKNLLEFGIKFTNQIQNSTFRTIQDQVFFQISECTCSRSEKKHSNAAGVGTKADNSLHSFQYETGGFKHLDIDLVLKLRYNRV